MSTATTDETEAAYDLPYKFSIRHRNARSSEKPPQRGGFCGEFDDFTGSVPCTKCGTGCGGGESSEVPVSYAVVMYAGAGLDYEPVCKACCTAAGGEPMWDLAVALDDLDTVLTGADRHWSEHLIDTAERQAAEMCAIWRRVGRI